MKRPAGLGASRKRAAEEHTKPNSKKARTSPSNEAVDETGVLMESTGEGPVGDLLALYEKFEKAEHSLDAANWLRGVIHESDRLLRNSEELKVDNEGGEKTMVKGLYGASLLRMGLLGADVRKPDEPQSLMDWLEVALEQLPAEFTLKGDYADWDTRFMWDRAVALWLFEGDQDDTSVTATQALTFSHSMLLSPSTTPIDHYLGFAGLLLPESDALSVLRLAQLAEFMDAASQNFEKHVKDMDEQRKSDLKAVQAEVNLILGSKVVAMLEPEDDETEEDVDESCKSESPKLLGTEQEDEVRAIGEKASQLAINLIAADIYQSLVKQEDGDEFRIKLGEALMNRSNLTQDEALRDQWFEEAEQAAGIRFDDDAEGEES